MDKKRRLRIASQILEALGLVREESDPKGSNSILHDLETLFSERQPLIANLLSPIPSTPAPRTVSTPTTVSHQDPSTSFAGPGTVGPTGLPRRLPGSVGKGKMLNLKHGRDYEILRVGNSVFHLKITFVPGVVQPGESVAATPTPPESGGVIGLQVPVIESEPTGHYLILVMKTENPTSENPVSPPPTRGSRPTPVQPSQAKPEKAVALPPPAQQPGKGPDEAFAVKPKQNLAPGGRNRG